MSRDSSMLSNPVWDRQYDHARNQISRKLYTLLICGWTAAGIVLSAFTASISQNWPVRSWGALGFLGFMLGILAVAMLGTVISNKSDNPVISALGYVLVAGPFGLMLGPVMAMYETSSVVKVFALTSMVVFALGIVGVMIPDDLSSWGMPLFGGLMLLIGGYFIVPILGFFGIPTSGAMTLLD